MQLCGDSEQASVKWNSLVGLGSLITLIPLFWYTKGFNLIGIGPASMIFFLTPTAQFFLGILYYKEPLVLHKLISFIFIWIAVIIYLNELRKE